MDDNNDELFQQFGDIDSQKIALEAAAETISGMFKAFRAQGLSEKEAAILVITLMRENDNEYSEGNGKSEHEA